MAKEADVSITAIYNSVKKLEQSGVIKGYILLIDSESLGINLVVLIVLRVNQGNDQNMQEEIAQYPQVRAMYKITGEWDHILICHFEGLQDLDEFVINQLFLPEVERVIFHVVLNVVKDDKRTFVP